MSRQAVNDVIEAKDCGLYADMLIQHSFTNLGASPPPKTNQNLRTLAPIREVITPIAEAEWGTKKNTYSTHIVQQKLSVGSSVQTFLCNFLKPVIDMS